MEQVNNPSADIAQQQQVYRDALVPAFNKQSQIDMGQAVAGLGNRYSGTYGQLTANQKALDEGTARAGLEKTIYDSGQSLYDQELNRANTFGGLNAQAQQIRINPYNFLTQALQAGGQNVSNYNNAQTSAFGTQGSMYNSDAYKQAMALQALGQIGSAAAGVATGGASTVAQGAGSVLNSALNQPGNQPYLPQNPWAGGFAPV